ncbi:MAG TPA: toprim domain-containing protein [Opitutales bacterium]|nr:toprim domain-containing protein [Opitutales bacterium]
MIYDAKEVNRRLAQEIARFCFEFLSSGRREGRQWKVCDVSNSPQPGKGNDSLVIDLEGGKQGVWCDFGNNNQTGSPLDLWMAVRGCDFKTALRQAKDWLGLKETGDAPGEFHRATARPTETPASEPKAIREDWAPIKEGSRAWKYLTEVRGIAGAVLKKYRVGEGDFWFGEVNASVPGIAFPAYDASGKRLLMVKYLALDRPAGKKMTRSNKDAVYHLIGMHACNPSKGKLVLCEGEIDMLTAATAGYEAVSVPFGAKGNSPDGRTNRGNAWIEVDWDWLQLWNDILLAYDNDEQGHEAVAAVKTRLGVDRCLFLDWREVDGKDLNEVHTRSEDEHLEQGSDVKKLLERARAEDPEAFKRTRDYEADIWEEFYPSSGQEPGYAPPWAMPFRFRPNQVTVWTGYSKHGKTICLSYVLVYLGSLGARACIYSGEVKARKTLKNAMRQVMGRAKPQKPTADGQGFEPDRELFERAIAWMDNVFFIYDRLGSVKLDDVLAVFGYAARRYGVTQFAIDSLMKLDDVHEDDNDSQKIVMNKLTDFAARFPGAHVHLVAHSKKPGEKRPETRYWPQKHDVLGSVHITNLPHNVVCVYRNVNKEMQLELPTTTEEEREAIAKQYDALFIVQAQREGEGDLPIRQLWFDVGASWQYFERDGENPRVFCDGGQFLPGAGANLARAALAAPPPKVHGPASAQAVLGGLDEAAKKTPRTFQH